jgi:hypothetical protein
LKYKDLEDFQTNHRENFQFFLKKVCDFLMFFVITTGNLIFGHKLGGLLIRRLQKDS